MFAHTTAHLAMHDASIYNRGTCIISTGMKIMPDEDQDDGHGEDDSDYGPGNSEGGKVEVEDEEMPGQCTSVARNGVVIPVRSSSSRLMPRPIALMRLSIASLADSHSSRRQSRRLSLVIFPLVFVIDNRVGDRSASC